MCVSTPWMAEHRVKTLSIVTESFSQVSSDNPSDIVKLTLGKGRSISVAAAICLDNSFPLAIEPSSSRADLILAPAKTWQLSIGQAMLETASTRAAELQTRILWCDGGQGGLSSILGNAIREETQAGRGSFIKTIGISVADSSATFYGRNGAWASWCLIATFSLISLALERGVSRNDWNRIRTFREQGHLWATRVLAFVRRRGTRNTLPREDYLTGTETEAIDSRQPARLIDVE